MPLPLGWLSGGWWDDPRRAARPPAAEVAVVKSLAFGLGPLWRTIRNSPVLARASEAAFQRGFCPHFSQRSKNSHPSPTAQQETTPSPGQESTPKPVAQQEKATPSPIVQQESTSKPKMQQETTPNPVQKASPKPEAQQEKTSPSPAIQQDSTPEPRVQRKTTPSPVQEVASKPIAQQESTPKPTAQQETTPSSVQEVAPSPVVQQENTPEPGARQEATSSPVVQQETATEPVVPPVPPQPTPPKHAAPRPLIPAQHGLPPSHADQRKGSRRDSRVFAELQFERRVLAGGNQPLVQSIAHIQAWLASVAIAGFVFDLAGRAHAALFIPRPALPSRIVLHWPPSRLAKQSNSSAR